MSEYILYQATEGDSGRFDSLAYAAYGDSYRYELILRANPRLMFHSVIPPGEVLRIEVIDQDDQLQGASLTPPWRLP